MRIARATNDLTAISKQYEEAFGFKRLGHFENHAGFDGVMLGHPQLDYHLEFTYEHGHKAPTSHSAESLMVFYIPDINQWTQLKEKMLAANFKLVPSHNPYWDENGATFEDLEQYRIVLCRQKWS